VLFVTDPVILDRDLVVLEDDLGMQGSEQPILLQHPALLGEHAIEALETMLAGLDTAALRELNAQVVRYGREEAVRAYIGGGS
jgi:glycine betaine/choline ABC-type transport system substrate-binding protein